MFDNDDSYGAQGSYYKKRLASIMGKLETLWRKGKADQAQKKAAKLAGIVGKIQKKDPGWQPDLEVEVWIEFGQGLIDDPVEEYKERLTGGSSYDSFESVSTGSGSFMDLVHSSAGGGISDFEEDAYYVPTAPVARMAPPPKPWRRKPPRLRPARPVHRPFPRRGRFGEEVIESDVRFNIFSRPIKERLASLQRRYDRALERGDTDKADDLLAKIKTLDARQAEVAEYERWDMPSHSYKSGVVNAYSALESLGLPGDDDLE